MKCVILAAGISSRLHPLTASTPKCLLQVGTYTILERTIRNALRLNISEFVIGTGYHATMIVDFVRKKFPTLKVEFVYNDRFAETNNSYSLSLTESATRGSEVLLMDSDIVFDQRILSELLSSPYGNCLAVRTTGEFDKEEVGVTVNDERRILRIGKEETQGTVFGESIGIEKFSQGGAIRLFEILHRRILQEGRIEELYETSFQELVDAGIPTYAIDIKDFPCIEIDSPEDLDFARREIVPKLDKM